VGQLRAILKEGNFTGLALCESKDSLRNRRHQRSIVLVRLYMEIQKTAHIKLNKEELMADAVRERERETFQEGITQKSALH
jgi:hypothetical protein